jgi:aspartate racemase
MIPLPRSREDGAEQPRKRSLGIIGGLDPLASADFLLKLLEVIERRTAVGSFDIVFEESVRPRPQAAVDVGTAASISLAAASRQLDVFDMTGSLARRGVSTVVLPCFASLEFLRELKTYAPVPIADMLEALVDCVRREFPAVRRVGVMTSDTLRERGTLQGYFEPVGITVLHPRGSWHGRDHSTERVRAACTDLVGEGAELIMPATSRLTHLLPALGATVPVPIVDVHRAYAEYVISTDIFPSPRPFKVGVVGGVGPAATVDFLRKVVSNTPAHRDQEHLKVLVEQNPQIPDRTEYLLGKGTDPTLALYATCRKLQAGEADVIAIPCNTAHAFIDSIQPHLDIPIINMLTATVSHVRERFPGLREVGLLATTGTLASGIYRRALQKDGFREVVPPPQLQERMMKAIYGPRGIKAGFTTGECVEDIHVVIDELVSRGVQVVILGCTELPLVFSQHEITSRGGQKVTLVDPTEILALRCVSQAMARSRR